MTNKEVFENYGTEQWVIESALCYMLQVYWDDYCKDKYNTRLPFNPVTFVKRFLKEETYCDTEFAEKSKLETLAKKVIDVIDIEDAEFIEVESELVDTQTSVMEDDLSDLVVPAPPPL